MTSDCMARLFANDVNLFAIEENEDECLKRLQPNLDKITEWALKWKMTMNPAKTETLTVKRTKNREVQLQVGGERIKEVKSHKHLGVHLQSDGKWGRQVDSMIEKANVRLNILKKLNHQFRRNTLQALYKSYVRPIMETSDTVWQDLTLGEAAQLEKTNQKAMGIITGAKLGTSPRVMYRETCLETLEDRRKNHMLVAFYRLIHSDRPCSMNHSMVRNVSDRNNYRVRNRASYCLERSRTEHYRKSFLPEAIRRWNDLNTSKVNLASANALKNSLKKNEIPNAIYDVTVTRRNNILLSRLRIGNLFSKMMADMDICECGEDIETTDHYLMKCNTFDEQR